VNSLWQGRFALLSGHSKLSVLPSARLHLGLPVGVETLVNLACVRVLLLPAMDQESLRILIQRKIRNGRLPHDGIKKVWSSRSDDYGVGELG
jgi:hypothetical protein